MNAALLRAVNASRPLRVDEALKLLLPPKTVPGIVQRTALRKARSRLGAVRFSQIVREVASASVPQAVQLVTAGEMAAVDRGIYGPRNARVDAKAMVVREPFRLAMWMFNQALRERARA